MADETETEIIPSTTFDPQTTTATTSTAAAPARVFGGSRDVVPYGVVFLDEDGEVRTARSRSVAKVDDAIKAITTALTFRNPKITANLVLGKTLFPILTEADEQHFAAVEDANRAKQAEEGKLTLQELVGGDNKTSLILEPKAVLEAARNK